MASASASQNDKMRFSPIKKSTLPRANKTRNAASSVGLATANANGNSCWNLWTSFSFSPDENCGCRAKEIFCINAATARTMLVCGVCCNSTDNQSMIGDNRSRASALNLVVWKQLHNKRNMTSCADGDYCPVFIAGCDTNLNRERSQEVSSR